MFIISACWFQVFPERIRWKWQHDFIFSAVLMLSLRSWQSQESNLAVRIAHFAGYKIIRYHVMCEIYMEINDAFYVVWTRRRKSNGSQYCFLS